MSVSDFTGWTAAALMVATFSCRDPLWMRRLAVGTNLAFITYGLLASLAPVLALHTMLLPINVWRYWQCTHTRPTGGADIDHSPKSSTWPPEHVGRYPMLLGGAYPGLIHRKPLVSKRLKEGGRK
jgi:hypothetical protein